MVKLPRLRFSTRALFALITLVALFCGWTLAQMRSRQQLLGAFRSRGIQVAMDKSSRKNPSPRSVAWTTPAAWFQPIRSIAVESGKLTPAELDHLQRQFPEADVVEVYFGTQFLPDSRPVEFPNPA
ncbi:MAG: hypothetical protein WD845_11190 [Pirellulales bacterium]